MHTLESLRQKALELDEKIRPLMVQRKAVSQILAQLYFDPLQEGWAPLQSEVNKATRVLAAEGVK